MPKIFVTEGPMIGHTFDLKEKNIVFMGRSSHNDIQINDIMVSRKHLKIFSTGRAFFIEDLRSTNGTFLNGEMIIPGECYELRESDTIVIGNSVLDVSEISQDKTSEVTDQPSSSPTVYPDEMTHFTRERRSRSPKNLQLIYKASELLDQSSNISEMLGQILDCLFDTLPRIDRAAVLLFEKGKIKEMVTRSKGDQARRALRYSRTVLDRVAHKGKAVKVSNTTYETQPEDLEDMDTLQIRSVMCAPMIIDTKVSGAIYVDSNRGPYDGSRKEDLILLNSLSGFVAAAIENANFLDYSAKRISDQNPRH